jgi:putative ABC transport system permease protein
MARVNWSESFSMSMGSLWANKLRSFLTLLGIVIGVLTIIMVVSVIQGLNKYVYTRMSFHGANDFSVSKFSLLEISLKDIREQIKRKDLTIKEMELLRRECRSCGLVGATVETRRTVKAGSQSLKDVAIRGVTYLDRNIGSVLELEAGRHLQKEDESHSRLVCVVGFDIKDKLFPHTDPISRWIKVGADNFLVVGLAKKKGKLLGLSQDDSVWIPITTFGKVYGSRRTVEINVHTASQEQMKEAQEEVRTLLRSARHRSFNDRDDFSILTSESFIQLYKRITSGIYSAMVAISFIALLVGGIVVMNIMLVSVSERTNEIGIRMAVGARRRDILLQFLIESAVLSGTGGLLGIFIGLSLAKIISAATSLPSSINPLSIITAIIMSASIGLFFGIYPANKAAKLNPVDALRSEQ